jgi:hypothetical protein
MKHELQYILLRIQSDPNIDDGVKYIIESLPIEICKDTPAQQSTFMH